jgi:hypothetical protein
MKSLLLPILLFLSFPFYAQYAVSEIPKELKQNVSAVVRNQETIVTLDEYNDMTFQYKQAVTVFNPNGDDVVSTSVDYDKEKSFKKLEVRIFDVNGEEIKKFKKRDFIDVSASGSGLYTDDRVLYIEYTPKAYPYTLEFVCEFKTSSTAFMPTWRPVRYYEVAAQQSSYTLHNPNQVPLSVRKYNLEAFNVTYTETPILYHYEIENLKPIKEEEFAPYYTEFVPEVKVAMQKFQLINQSADVKNWIEFGNWQRTKLLNGRDEISEATKAKVAQLVIGVEDPKEKARIIYKYMQDKTRYISIQAGIGGWQPTPAAEVDDLSYGDCKGLTNYTMALLKSQGIESYYTLVNAGPDTNPVDVEFVASQFNHAILTVPFEDETVFLECTDQETPFNFLGTHTDDRKVLMMTPEGGVMTKTHTYTKEDNLQVLKANATIDTDLKVTGTLTETSGGLAYNNKYRLSSANQDDLKMYYKQMWGHLNDLSLANINLGNDKKQVVFTESLNFETKNYVSTAGDRILLNPNIFNRHQYLPAAEKKRKLPLKIRRGATFKDEIEILLPEGYAVEAAFDPITITSVFGNYKASIETVNASTIKYSRELVLDSGTFPKEEYNNYVQFIQQIVKKDKSKIVLSKQ